MKNLKNVKLMLLTALVAMGSVNAFAQELATTVWRYTASGNDATLVGFVAEYPNASKADVVIPNQVTDPVNATKKYNVVAIEDGLFTAAEKALIKTISFEATKITAINSEVFANLPNLTSIDLTKATGLTSIADAAFKGSKITALDLSKTKLTTIGNLLGTNYKYTAADGTYTWQDANAANTKTLLAITPKISEAIPAVGGSIPGSDVFGSKDAAYAYNLTLPGAKQYGDNLPYTKATANTYNKANIAGAVDTGDPVTYTAETAAAYNATLKGAMPYGFVLDEFNYGTFNTATSQNKAPGDKLTKEDVDAYNATLTAAGAVAVGDPVLDAEGNPVTYTEEEAYAYNLALGVAGLAIEGNEDPAGATNDEIDAWNLANVPGACKKGDAKPSGKTYTEGTGAGSAHDELIKLCDKYSVKKVVAGTKKTGDEVEAVNNNTLASLVLPATWTKIAPVDPANLAGSFENCTALASVEFTGNNKVAQTIGARAFLGTKVAALDFSKTLVSSIPADIVIDQNNVKENSTLESVKLNTLIYTVAEKTFMNCKALKEFIFPTDEEYAAAKITKIVGQIASKAFAYTALESFTVPSIWDETTANTIKASAFEGCESLKTFTYLPEGLFPKAIANAMAFPGCTDVAFKTTNAYITNNLEAPKNTHYVLVSSGYQTEFKPIEFKDKAGKYYIKYLSTANIRVKKDEAKVYNAYLEDGDETLVIQSYKTVSGYYEIAAGATVLIITNKADLQYEPGKVPAGSSWIAEVDNALQIVGKGGVSRAALDAVAGPNKVIYGWVSSATKGTNFLKITSGSTFNEGTMFAIAAEPAKEGRLNIVWRDEFGNDTEAEATAIETVKNESENGPIYNLQGARVNGTQKGVYIQNGKKFIVK